MNSKVNPLFQSAPISQSADEIHHRPVVNPTKQRGATLVEILFVVLLIMVIIAAAVTGYSRVRESQQTSQIIKDVGVIVAAAQAWRQGRTSYSGISLANLQISYDIPTNPVATYSVASADSNRAFTVTATRSGAVDARVVERIADALFASAEVVTNTSTSDGIVVARYR